MAEIYFTITGMNLIIIWDLKIRRRVFPNLLELSHKNSQKPLQLIRG